MSGIQYLHQSIASGAMHDSDARYDPPKCHPKTRTMVLDAIMKWIRNKDRNTKILWLNGPAGAGKSAIAQTICEMSAESGHLGASFFFSRTDPTRNNPTNLFPTIAYQLAMYSLNFKSHLETIIELDPSVITKAMDIQLQQLILLPFQPLNDVESTPSRVVVIDGLDECIDEKRQVRILQLICSALSTGGHPFCVLITSRSEHHISTEFQQRYISKLYHQISLAYTDDTDIRLVLESGFLEILENPMHRDSMHDIARPWPSQDIIKDLVTRASGQFIYAVTVLKY
ncbi:hypothetical protein BDQ12DRAFT_631559, partial [Crucibulum laeve]